MKAYNVVITETRQRVITVKAESPEWAMSEVMDKYRVGAIELTKDDIAGAPTFSQTFK